MHTRLLRHITLNNLISGVLNSFDTLDCRAYCMVKKTTAAKPLQMPSFRDNFKALDHQGWQSLVKEHSLA